MKDKAVSHHFHLASRLFRGVFAALLVVAGLDAGAADSPKAVVEQFYTTYIAERPAGLPDGAALARLQPYLSKRLHALIVAANVYQQEFAKSNPDEKPPFVDGDHFSSVFEGPQSFAIARVARRVRSHDVHVRFSGGAGAPSWVDVVVVKKEAGKYVIDDVRFSGAGDFNPAGSLVAALQSRED